MCIRNEDRGKLIIGFGGSYRRNFDEAPMGFIN